ncbi:MAG: Omp28-related outer membrane protein [Chitinophagaceae bacterium]|nr:Omp28-related outer membrane protein [Chitinophagaceae bacterium]
MQKILSIAAAGLILFGLNSCTKNKSNSTGGNPFSNGTTVIVDPTPTGIPVGTVPGAFTKKAVLEEFTGEWCGWCPEGAAIMDAAIAANPNTVIGVGVHDGDPMELPAFNSYIKGLTGVTGFPNGSVQRAKATGRGSWMGQITTALGQTANCGLAMVTKSTGNSLDVDVYIGYNAAITSSTNLTVYLTEDDVPQSSPGAQGNYSSTVVVDPNTWTHGHVLRAVLTANPGDVVTLNSTDKYTKVSFKGIDLSQYTFSNIANVHVVAFVNDNTGNRDILNAQQATLNEIKKWD